MECKTKFKANMKLDVIIHATITIDDASCDSLETLQDAFNEGGEALLSLESEFGDMEIDFSNVSIEANK